MDRQKAIDYLKAAENWLEQPNQGCDVDICFHGNKECPLWCVRSALAALESEPVKLSKARGIINGMYTVLENDGDLTKGKIQRIARQLRKAYNLMKSEVREDPCSNCRESELGLLKNFLAVIHRDGGHHTAEVGLEQSVKDAQQIYYQLRDKPEPKCILCNDTGFKPPYRFGGVAIPCDCQKAEVCKTCGESRVICLEHNTQGGCILDAFCPDCQKSEPVEPSEFTKKIRECWSKDETNGETIHRLCDYIDRQAAELKNLKECKAEPRPNPVE